MGPLRIATSEMKHPGVVTALVIFEAAWTAYMCLLIRVMLSIVMREPRGILQAKLIPLGYALPVVSMFVILGLCFFLVDLSRRTIQKKALWGVGLVFLPPVTFPLYYFLYMR